MAQQQQRFSARDEVYLNSPGFESYLSAGGVFIFVFTAIFIYSIKASFAWLVWPGLFVAVVAGYITLKFFLGREYRRKLAEIKAEQSEAARRSA